MKDSSMTFARLSFSWPLVLGDCDAGHG